MEEAYRKHHQRHESLNERITGDEAIWLSERIGRDGVLHENEKALAIRERRKF